MIANRRILATSATCGDLGSVRDDRTRKAPPSTFVQLRTTVWTVDARDTRPYPDDGEAEFTARAMVWTAETIRMHGTVSCYDVGNKAIYQLQELAWTL